MKKVDEMIKKAGVLIEALPYMRKFYGRTFVIKYGGAAQVDEALKDAFAQDIALLNFIGIHPVIVHGGGPKISATMEKLGKKPVFVEGQRFTDKETMDIVEMVLGGLINKEIVGFINSHGGSAVGLSGKDAGLIKAKRKKLAKASPDTGATEIIDLGLVGEVTQVNPGILHGLKEKGFIPVIAPVGVGPKGETLNINADFIANAVAESLGAEKLIFLTDVEGVKDAKGNVISTVKSSKARKLVKDGTVKGGMIPKVSAASDSIKAGVGKVHIIDGRIPHSLLLEIFTEEGIGTEITP